MSRAWSLRALGVVCALGVGLTAEAQGVRPMTVAGTGRAPTWVVAPGDASAPRPVTVYLHGLWGDPRPGCAYFRHHVAERSWLVCPTAPGFCAGGGASWAGSMSARIAAVDRARAVAGQRAPETVDRAAPGVLIGFSQGAYEVWQQARARPGRWRGVAFIGAYIRLRRAQLEAAGVRRALFAAGRYDETWRTLRDTAQRLRDEGYEARFVDLGAQGHRFAARPEARGPWRDALRWLESEE